MLKLKPNCECCDRDLPSDSQETMICSYECTFCSDCVENILLNVCPNCGGGFVPRPIRPAKAWRNGVNVEAQPASTERVLSNYSKEDMSNFAQSIKHIAPHQR